MPNRWNNRICFDRKIHKIKTFGSARDPWGCLWTVTWTFLIFFWKLFYFWKRMLSAPVLWYHSPHLVVLSLFFIFFVIFSYSITGIILYMGWYIYIYIYIGAGSTLHIFNYLKWFFILKSSIGSISGFLPFPPLR